MKTDFSLSYFVGTDGQYSGAIFDDCGNGIDESDWELDIPQRPLQALIIDDIDRDENSVWGISDGELVEIFFLTEEEEFETIRSGYREVFWTEKAGGRPASFEGDRLYCNALAIGDEVQ